MPTLFDAVQAGDLQLANRIVMAPLTRNRSPNAIPRPITATYYAQRATAGLLISEATAISHQGQGYALPDTYNSFNLRGAPDERARAPFDPFLEPDPSLVFGQEYGYDDNSGMDNVSLWDDEDLADEADLLDPDDLENLPCPDYQAYLDVYETLDFDDTPLGHDEYHLLEAELEGLVSLEYEFGYLMPEPPA